MQFLFFFILVSSICLFHRREHRAFEYELKDILKDLRQGKMAEGADWRIIRQDRGIFCLRRAFAVKNRKDALRYALPVILLCSLLVFLQSWKLFCFYLGVLMVKWFVTQTRIDTAKERYDVTVAGVSLFGRNLAELPEV